MGVGGIPRIVGGALGPHANPGCRRLRGEAYRRRGLSWDFKDGLDILGTKAEARLMAPMKAAESPLTFTSSPLSLAT
jgi:hypothetical protein